MIATIRNDPAPSDPAPMMFRVLPYGEDAVLVEPADPGRVLALAAAARDL
ncbi:MAG: hypothetical protein QOJ37_318, partial [Pseudonocardiales bacterium]|nr:hypothetical protein [Pseudonocardiales bacterium]